MIESCMLVKITPIAVDLLYGCCLGYRSRNGGFDLSVDLDMVASSSHPVSFLTNLGRYLMFGETV